ncbi:hypothetical protein, partial [Thermoflexus sp.]|uniref:hypothetical protein n=1 Tax=Thermoflexus sp. TaxID=1969742 RepID=UPI0035E460D4
PAPEKFFLPPPCGLLGRREEGERGRSHPPPHGDAVFVGTLKSPEDPRPDLDKVGVKDIIKV